jgi:hypothetical protein
MPTAPCWCRPERLQRGLERQPGTNEQCELAQEDGDIARSRQPAADAAAAAEHARLHNLGVDRQMSEIFDTPQDLIVGRGLNLSNYDLSALRQRAIAVLRHPTPLQACRNAEHLIDCGQAGAAFGDAIVGHRGHAFGERDLLKLDRVSLWPDRLTQPRRHLDHFKDTTTSVKAGEAAPLAASGVVNGISCLETERRVALIAREIAAGELVRLLAVLAQHAHEPLSDNGADA